MSWYRATRTVVIVDVVESVRLMQEFEEKTIARWRGFVEEVSTKVLPSWRGRLVKSLGDGMLLEFETVRDGVAAALAIQRRATDGASSLDEAEAIRLRVGVHCCDVVVDAIDIYGAGVNLAARLASLAAPGETVISTQVHDLLVPGLDAWAQDLGPCYLKHLASPVQAYRLNDPERRAETPLSASGSSGAPVKPMVAVLPLRSAGGSAGADSMGDLVTDAITAALSKSLSFRVVSQLSSREFSATSLGIGSVMTRLGAQFVVSGVCRQNGEKLVVTLELATTDTHAVIWSELFSFSVSELFATISFPITEIAQHIELALSRSCVTKAEALPMPNIDSATLLNSAIALMHRLSPESFLKARAMLEHLIERHPRNAEPRAWLAKWYSINAAQAWTVSPHEGGLRAREAVERALSLQPDHSLAWCIKGLLASYLDRDFTQGQMAYERALLNNPNESLAWLYQSTVQAWRGDGEQAVISAEAALQLSPLDPLKYYFDSLAGAAMLGGRQYERCIALSKQSLRANIQHIATYKILAMAQSLSGDIEGARTTIAHLLRREPTFSVSRFLEVSPWGQSPMAAELAIALNDAGAPRHSTT